MSNDYDYDSDEGCLGIVAIGGLATIYFISKYWDAIVQMFIFLAGAALAGLVLYLAYLVLKYAVIPLVRTWLDRRAERAACPVCNGFNSVIMHDYDPYWCTKHKARLERIVSAERVLRMDDSWRLYRSTQD